MNGALDCWVLICELLRQIRHALIVRDEHDWVDRIIHVLLHQLGLDLRATLVDQVEGHLWGGIEVKLVDLLQIDEIFSADKVFEASLVFEKHVDWRTDKFVEIICFHVAVFVLKEVLIFLEKFSTFII